MTARKLTTLGGAVAACAALGAAGAYVGDAASSPSTSSAASAGTSAPAGHNGKRRGPLGRLRRAVHADLVVPAKGGKFVDVTLDRGVVQQVSSSSITLKEGTKTATYKTVTVELPSTVAVRIDRKAGKLSDVKAGQHALVVKGPKRTRVIARS
jgi:hypothetical protein